LQQPSVRVGLFDVGLETYLPQFTGLLDRLTRYQAGIAERLRGLGAHFSDAGMVDHPVKARRAASHLQRDEVEHCQACSAPEIASVFHRAGIDYHLVTRYLEDAEAWREIQAADVHRDEAGRLVIDAWQPGRYLCKTSGGRTYRADVPALPPSLDLQGPWEVCFASSSGEPEQIMKVGRAPWAGRRLPVGGCGRKIPACSNLAFSVLYMFVRRCE
jgi:hypothetical protein